MNNQAIVESLFAAWEAKSLEGILALMTSDAVYENVGMSQSVGHEQIREGLAPFIGAARRIEWVVHHIAQTADGVVLTERTDIFELADRTITVPVMGVFELRGGLIHAWRDYFDLPGFQKQMA